ncbi:redoxin domain-containing protein [Rasiella sp. SM2506]|uniref:redoxin domain-containing protein n=1 Tax=Rasiella sp. SM2506 TaxID=3423914 RepID=UPI003D7A8378
MKYLHTLVLLACFLSITTISQNTPATSQIRSATKAAKLSKDNQSKTVAIENLSFIKISENKKKTYVVIFLGTDCPISQKYVHTLREMHTNYANDITLFGIVPNNFSDKKISAFKNDFKIPFEILRDADNKFAKEFNATVTPESFLFDSNGIVYYDGAIDDWFYALGRNKLKPNNTYLINAIEDLINGRPILANHIDAIGCFIEMEK